MIAMTSDQYPELVEFLSRKFEEVQRHSTALVEQVRDELRIFAEGTNVRFEGLEGRLDRMDGRLDRMDERFDTRLGSLEGWVRHAVTDCDQRLQALE